MAKSISIETYSGFCPETKTFHSLRPAVPLPPPSLPLSLPAFALSLLPSPLPSHPALIDATSSTVISFPTFFSRVNSLASFLQANAWFPHGSVAFILSPATVDIPVLYFALLSIGVAVAPANPASTPSELSRLIRLAKPSAAFSISSAASKLPGDLPTILLDSHRFLSYLESDVSPPEQVVQQSDVATIHFSSGTTGPMKAAALTHRSIIAMIAGFHAHKAGQAVPDVTLLLAPMFHSLGFFFALKAIAMGDTLVVMGRATLPEMMLAAERHGATQLITSPPVIVAMTRSEKALQHDLPALKQIICGGAPLPEADAEKFSSLFPSVMLCLGYGSTEGGGISRMMYAEECRYQKSVGRLTENVQLKITDPVTKESLFVGKPGELWIKSPAIMKGYIGDEGANCKTFDSEGWMKTGDFGYIDENGFLYIIDRLKELIKYKAYQVAPAELEELLLSSPYITDAAVIPYPQEEVGQIPMAFVVRKSESNISEVEVMDYVAKQVAPYKKIRKVVFVDSIPRSATGKILRKELLPSYTVL